MNNIKLSYLYCDGGNYKRTTEVVFSNPHRTKTNQITKALEHAFLQDGLLIAH
jgi:hypothetical protein